MQTAKLGGHSDDVEKVFKISWLGYEIKGVFLKCFAGAFNYHHTFFSYFYYLRAEFVLLVK